MKESHASFKAAMSVNDVQVLVHVHVLGIW